MLEDVSVVDVFDSCHTGLHSVPTTLVKLSLLS